MNRFDFKFPGSESNIIHAPGLLMGGESGLQCSMGLGAWSKSERALVITVRYKWASEWAKGSAEQEVMSGGTSSPLACSHLELCCACYGSSCQGGLFHKQNIHEMAVSCL